MSLYEHALVVGKFAPLHRGHQLLLDRATYDACELTVVVWSNPDFGDMPNAVRAGWIHDLYPRALVIVADDGPPNDAPDLVHRQYVARLLAAHRVVPDVVYSSEPYGPGFAEHLGAAHVMVDEQRVALSVSATMVRNDMHSHRALLDPRVYRHFIDKVVFLGAESTGKSTLAVRMADELQTAHVAEYGRDHYETQGGVLDLDDYVTIAQRHRELEDDAAGGAIRYLFVDTNAITTMFFSYYYNGDSLAELGRLAAECRTRYRYVIVCDDDIAFEQDGWRDNEIWRARMQAMVVHDLAVREIAFHLVRGTLDERVAQVKAILAGDYEVSSPQSVSPRSVSLGPRPARLRTTEPEAG